MDVVYFYKFIGVEKAHGKAHAALLRPKTGAPPVRTAALAAVQERSFFVGQISRQAGGFVRQTQGGRAALCRLNKSVE